MAMVLLAAALLSQPPESAVTTAQQIYDGCRLFVALPAGPLPEPNPATAAEQEAEAVCAVLIAVQLAEHAANDAIGDSEPGRRQSFCPPDSVLNADDAAETLARAYITWFEQHPAVHDAADGDAILRRALAEKWPCPH